MLFEMLAIVLAFILSVIAVGIVANRISDSKLLSNIIVIILFGVVIFIVKWIDEGSLENVILFFLYSLMAFPLIIIGIVVICVCNIIFSKLNQTLNQPIKKVPIFLIPILSILLLAAAIGLLKFADYHNVKRIDAYWEQMPHCGPAVHGSCRSP